MNKNNDSAVEQGTEIVKKKGKPRGGNSPVIGDNGLQVGTGDNSRYLGFTMQVGYLPTIDLYNAEQVEERLHLYFQMCFDNDMKPTVSGMALALGNGITRQTLWAIKTGQPTGSDGYKSALPRDCTDSIKKAYAYMENLWENYMQNGKINPVSGIFLGKNNFGYQDKTEYVVTPNVQQEADFDEKDIRKRYLIDSPTSDSTDSDSDS